MTQTFTCDGCGKTDILDDYKAEFTDYAKDDGEEFDLCKRCYQRILKSVKQS